MRTKILITLFLFPILLQAQEGRLIVQRYEEEMKASDQEVSLNMQLISKNGKIRERKLSWSSRINKDNLEASYLYFSEPTDIKGTAFLTIENSAGQEDQWLYLPALKRSRRISSSEKSKNFMGTDFTYEDIGSENSDDSNYKLIRKETSDSGLICIIEAIYKDASKIKETGYSKRILYINSENNMMVKSEYYNIDGTINKILECSDFKFQESAKKWRPQVYRMKNIQKGTQTILKFKKYNINQNIDPNRFTLRYLESN